MAKKNDKQDENLDKKSKEQKDLEPNDLEPEDDEEDIDEDDESEDDEDESDDDGEEDDDDSKRKDNKDSKKNSETPEQKHARLKRQLAQQEKRMGLKSDGDKKPEVKQKPSKAESSLSQGDLYALMRADVPEDDVSEVADYAKLKNISIKEALKSSVVRTILKERKEERETADATSTRTQRRSNSKPSSDALLENARKGAMPEADADIETMIRGRKAYKR